MSTATIPTTQTLWGPAAQQPPYPSLERMAPVLARLEAAEPVVETSEIDELRERMAAVARGDAFALHGGACAESFDDGPEAVALLLQVFLQMVVVLGYSASLPIVKILRAAGQLAKPRSSLMDGTWPSYFGDHVNEFEAGPGRVPDPERLWRGYEFSRRVWKQIQELARGGFADLAQVHSWNQAFVRDSPQGQRYEMVARDIDAFLGGLRFAGIDQSTLPELHEARFYISHEGLVLPYEGALTRTVGGRNVAQSAHFLWIGERTRQFDLAHVKFFADVSNPIGVKLGPTTTPEQVVELCERLNPDHIPGRLTFIVRMGAKNVRVKLPALLRAVQAYECRIGLGPLVAWLCDPMHGNTFSTADGQHKTRLVDAIVDEILGFFEAHYEVGTIAGGLSLEMTGEDVTECVGGSDEICEADLSGGGYKSKCDPRLNRLQALDVAFIVAEMLKGRRPYAMK